MNVVFDGENLLIKVNQEVTTLDIQTDIYSAWKEWIQTTDNSKFLPALRTIGGDPTVQEKTVAPYFFLMNGWKIKPASWNHTLNLIGNLFVDNPEIYGSNVVVPSDGNYTVLVNMSTTSDASRLTVGSGVTQQDKQDIANLVEVKTGQPIKEKQEEVGDTVTEVQETIGNVKETVNGVEETVIETQAQTLNVELHHIGRIKLDGDYLLVHDTLDQLIAKYRLVKDSEGRIIERIPEEI